MKAPVVKMSRKYKSRTRQTRKPPFADAKLQRATLTGPAGMGGIIGGGGYDYQTRFVVCNVPRWLTDPAFIQLFHEGTGDVDVRFGRGESERRLHLQVKDHIVSLSQFRQAVADFVLFDKGKPGVYDKFALACPALSPRLRPLESALRRVRDAMTFYDTRRTALASERNGIRKILGKLGLASSAAFVTKKLSFQLDAAQLHEDEVAAKLFIADLQTLPDYKMSQLGDLLPAYAELLRLVSSNRGKVIKRRLLEDRVAASIRRPGGKEGRAIYLDVHNWTRERFEPKADYELNWSNYFDRTTRRIPDSETFGGILLPKLYALQRRIAAATSKRLIKLRGKCCLSTGLALGMAFPENGGWVFEVSQPQMPVPWRSTASPAVGYPVHTEELRLDPNGDSVALVLSVTGDAAPEVHDFIKGSALRAKALLCVRPANQPGSRSLLNASEAASLALASRDALKKCLLKHKVHTTNLFIYGPIALAVFLGQRLTAIGRIRLYEYRDPGYSLIAEIRT